MGERSIFLLVLHIQHNNLLFLKGIVICNVVQMRPRTWVGTRTQQYQTAPSSLPNTHTQAHTMHSSPWPAVAPKLPWLPDSRLLRRRAGGRGKGVAGWGVLQHTACSHHNHLPSSPPSPSCLAIRLRRSRQVSSPGLKMLLLGTLLCGLGNKMKRFLGSQGPSANLAFPERSAQQEAEWASSRYCGRRIMDPLWSRSMLYASLFGKSTDPRREQIPEWSGNHGFSHFGQGSLGYFGATPT